MYSPISERKAHWDTSLPQRSTERTARSSPGFMDCCLHVMTLFGIAPEPDVRAGTLESPPGIHMLFGFESPGQLLPARAAVSAPAFRREVLTCAIDQSPIPITSASKTSPPDAI
eukprot:GGOE01006545.1.p2 GENE.GGOE01006545.1~~GGOE01006545.1.p2  ORF type:complete len:114 (-),score=0.01 GGOE01006545.1:550-891(-)